MDNAVCCTGKKHDRFKKTLLVSTSDPVHETRRTVTVAVHDDGDDYRVSGLDDDCLLILVWTSNNEEK